MPEFLHYLASGYLWTGMAISVEITVVAMSLALMLGLGLALMRESANRMIRAPAFFYVWFVRGTPMLLQLVFLYTALPTFGVTMGSVSTAILGFTLNEAAFAGEIIRGGMRAVNRNQRIAAASLGMGIVLTLRRIVLPQALRAILPALGNDAISMLKFTSLGSVIAVNELMLRSQTIVSQNFLFFQVFCAAGVMYLAVTTLMSFAQGRLEARLRREAPPGTDGEPGEPRPRGAVGAAEALVRRAMVDAGPGDEAFVDLRDVSKSYGGLPVIRGLDLVVRRGEVVVLMGPSGSGKSTLLRLINHLESVDGGEIFVGGETIGYQRVNGSLRPLKHLARARAGARIGMVFQHFNLFDHLPVIDNVSIAPVHVYGQDAGAARQTATALLRDMGLGHHVAQLPYRLSGGQQQRVAIARALAISPRLMLFDEPTSALDPELVGEVLQVMRRLADAGMTMIVVTHEVRFARDVADRIVFMADGRVVEQGTPDEILGRPREERTRKFLSHLERA